MPGAVLVLALALAAGDAEGAAAGLPPEPAPSPIPVTGCAEFDLALAGIGSLEEDLARTAGLTGASPLFPGVLRRPSGARPLWICDGPAPPRDSFPDPRPAEALEWSAVPPASLSKLHSGWADDRNDGALWAGRGLSAEVSAGVRVRWKWFTAQLAPLAAWQENRPFYAPAGTVPGLSPYANPLAQIPGNTIDLPLRMGPSAFWTADLGTSTLRADAWDLAAGISSENLWWGPGIRNSLLMTNSGPGFPHFFAGTTRPLDIWIGWAEAELLWGQLRPSRWFDGDTGNRRLFEGVVLTFAPAFQENLTLGIDRVFVYADARLTPKRLLKPFIPPVLHVWVTGAASGNARDENQLASVFFRWAFPAVQLEVYGEWGRDDFAGSVNDFLGEPGHAQAYLLGLQKLFPAGPGWIRFQGELAHTLEVPPNHPTRTVPSFYTHGVERQGYTNGGQMLGAGLGPQGDTQFLAVDWFRNRGSIGFFAERVARWERWFYDHVANPKRHDVAVTGGLRGTWARGEWDVQWELGLSRRLALDFGPQVDAVDGMLALRWWPGRATAPVLPGRR